MQRGTKWARILQRLERMGVPTFRKIILNKKIISIINSDSSARAEKEREIEALQGRLVSIDEMMETRNKQFDNAPEFIGRKLGELEREKNATRALLEEKVRELNALQFPTFTEEQLDEAIEAIQNGDNNYKLRVEVSSLLKSIISIIYVGTIGHGPNIDRAKQMLEEDPDYEGSSEVEWQAGMPDDKRDERFVWIKFTNGEVRAFSPNPDDPLDYIEMVSTTDDADPDTGLVPDFGTISIQLDSFLEIWFRFKENN
jgi:hypothetical protein